MTKIKTSIPFLIALIGGLCFITLGITGPGLTHYPGDLIDGRFNNYLLEHAYNYFTGIESSFWNAPFMFPEEKVISYSDNLLGTAPFYILFRLLGCDRELAFQCWYILLAILNFTSCYILLKCLFKNVYAAAIGAMVFAFSLALHSQMAHAQTFPRFAIPLSFLMGLMFLKELKVKYFFVSVFFVVYQFYCGIYIGFMLASALGFFFLVSLFLNHKLYFEKFGDLKWWFVMTGALILNILILWPLMKPYLARAHDVGYYSYESISGALLTPKSFLFSWGGSLFWSVLNSMCVKDFVYYCEYQVFAGGFATLGLIVFLLVLISKLSFKKKLERLVIPKELWVLFGASILCFLFFMRFGEFSLYKILYRIPGFGSMRALQRIINIELVFYAIGAAFCFDLLPKNKRYIWIAFLGCVVFIILDNYVKPDYRHRHEVSESKGRVEPLIEKIRKTGFRKVLSYEPDSVDSNINDFQLDAMLAAQSLGLRTLNGYSATSPENYSNYWSWPNEGHRMKWLIAKNLSMDSVFVVK